MLQCRYEKPFNQKVKNAILLSGDSASYMDSNEGKIVLPSMYVVYQAHIDLRYPMHLHPTLEGENGPEIEKYNAKTCWKGFNVCMSWAFIKSREKRICMIIKILEPIQDILRFKLSLPKSTVKKKHLEK